jgi:hypothetical protein
LWHSSRAQACSNASSGWPRFGASPGRVSSQWFDASKQLPLNEPLLEEAPESCFSQNYPAFQIVFGIQDPTDPALEVVRRLRIRFPGCDAAVVVNPTIDRTVMTLLPGPRNP